ncbi:capsule biosynthesis protein [Croceicoccus gelatinilyticus]|uniref:capsule biosynthesis protein n=1 Tax=Croceicoccus gelatinilyticus TaxID=2835536 RepID=UPI001BCB93AE|nr:capsular biosynthesis protein [Croceicoccus gelatinilyticus]MBS7671203.1 capsular biosynthesis protein [Croceicoccus gelatinilyticus]
MVARPPELKIVGQAGDALDTVRRILFLQGPPGPLFRELGKTLADRGFEVFRINLSGGDRYDWPRGGIDYTGTLDDWPIWLDRFLDKHQITELMLFGDCRAHHESARRIAVDRGVDVHVLEEGYIRPHWMTLEEYGVNGYSRLPKDPDWYLEKARHLPDEGEPKVITASFNRRARDSYWYYHHNVTGRVRFPHYRSHRPGSVVVEGLNWVVRFAGRTSREKRTVETIERLADAKFFLFPLQLSSDYQIRRHSAFNDMESAARFVVESFIRNAPSDTHLLVKAHPLDPAARRWPKLIASMLSDDEQRARVHYIDGGNLEKQAARSLGLVCVNSTSGTLALAHDIPVNVLGDAVYDIAGITDQKHLDDFWSDPTPPDRRIWTAFRKVLFDRCLISGGIASKSAVETLIKSILKRLGVEPVHKDNPVKQAARRA